MNNPSTTQNSKRNVWIFAVLGSLAGLGALTGGFYLILGPAFDRFTREAQVATLQSEARLVLRSVLTSQMLLKAEHDFFFSDLKYGDFTTSTTNYSLGFVEASPPKPQTQSLGLDPQRHFLLSELGDRRDNADPEALLVRMREICPDCVATDAGFKAFAFANLDADAEWDVWTIDQDGNLVHLSDDLADEAAEDTTEESGAGYESSYGSGIEAANDAAAEFATDAANAGEESTEAPTGTSAEPTGTKE